MIVIRKKKTPYTLTASDNSPEQLLEMAASFLERLMVDKKGKALKRVRMMVDILRHRKKGVRIEIMPMSPKK